MNYCKQIYRCSAIRTNEQNKCEFFEGYAESLLLCTYVDEEGECCCEKAINNMIKTDIDKVKISIETKDKTYHFYGELK